VAVAAAQIAATDHDEIGKKRSIRVESGSPDLDERAAVGQTATESSKSALADP